MISRRRSPWITGIGLLILAVYLFPIYWMMTASLKKQQDIYATTPQIIPLHPQFHTWASSILGDSRVLGYVRNSIFVATGTMVLTLVLAAPAAYALAKLPMRGKSVIMLFSLSSLMLPAIMIATPLFVIFTKLGLTDSLWGLMLADTTLSLPYAIVLLRPTFLSIPIDLAEAAQIDGCSAFGAFWRVIVPMARPGIATVAVLSFLWAWGDFVFALTLTSSEDKRVVTTGLANFFGQNITDWAAVMGFSTLAMLPPLVIFLVGQRQVVSGLLAGGTKG